MSSVALYGRTYLDAEVTIPLDQLATGKGKVDVEVVASLGGFPCNAARALASRISNIAVVTRISSLDLPRLRAVLPPGTAIHAVTDSEEWPPVTVIINPAQECRLLRTGRAGNVTAADVGTAPDAHLHIFGRVDPSLITHVHGLTAWCAGSGNAIDACDLACVNTAEARAILGRTDGTPRELAVALVERASRKRHPGRHRAWRCRDGRRDARRSLRVSPGADSARPDPHVQGRRRCVRGALLRRAVLDERGELRTKPALERALAVAQAAAGKFMT